MEKEEHIKHFEGMAKVAMYELSNFIDEWAKKWQKNDELIVTGMYNFALKEDAYGECVGGGWNQNINELEIFNIMNEDVIRDIIDEENKFAEKWKDLKIDDDENI